MAVAWQHVIAKSAGHEFDITQLVKLEPARNSVVYGHGLSLAGLDQQTRASRHVGDNPRTFKRPGRCRAYVRQLPAARCAVAPPVATYVGDVINNRTELTMSLSFSLLRAVLLTASLALTTTCPAEEAPLRIGVLNDQSSSTADVTGSGSVVAARLAIEDFGDRVAGRRIELMWADHQNRSDIAAGIARRWIDVDQVSAIVDGGTSAAALAIQDIVREKQKVAMFSGPATSDLTGKACSPFGFHWTYDTYALASTVPRAMAKSGADTWFFITSNYAFGHALERDATAAIKRAGGKVLGGVRHPLGTADFSSFLLQAQASKAQIIGLANSGDDSLNTIKQAGEFGIVEGGQRIAGLLLLINTVHGLGLKAAQGIIIAEAFYWDMDDATRRFSARFEALAKKKPNMIQAGVYSAVLHYLKSVQKAGSIDGPTVSDVMRSLPVDDFMSKNVTIRGDGRVMRDMHLFQVKTPAESKAPWDYYKYLSTVRGEDAFRPVAESECALLK
ncbi:ABC transporter substrate-binding protein [Rhodopseudomonas sp. HC1]|uniref:ABC transporter substrate-binding protein n=1 Tax=Rhodopseudomonas infernalis TaxID=2897386 RepID=UPI001EE9A116|nr:ABC transporter substrate-binding protein [Rhodopseudomonas infernalis]MCG6203586.1 ABC transporter substrate-binding protein [Rhodopseudomonas infernalis]